MTARPKDPNITVIDKRPPELIEFTVAGKGTFPLDMLRYDRCWPKTQDDMHVVQQSLQHEGDAFVVTLQAVGFRAPTYKRWQSFGWHVASEAEARYLRNPEGKTT